MPRTMKLLCLSATTLVLLAVASTPRPARADPPPYTDPGPYVPDAAVDSMLVVVELRPLSSVEFDRDVAARRHSDAKTR